MANGNGKPAPIRDAIVKLLLDGKPHFRSELEAICAPSGLSAVRWHITEIRRRMPDGELIIAGINGRKVYYQWVRLLA